MKAFGRGAAEIPLETARVIGGGLKTVAEAAGKATSKASRPERVIEEAAEKKEKYGAKKASDEKQTASEKALYKGMMKGPPGLKVQVPKAHSKLMLRDQTVSKVHGREKYEKFSKELRNYAHRLKNNKDASTDMKKRLEHIRARGKNVTARELEDELRVMKVVGRVTGASKRSAAWKSFLTTDRVTGAKILKKDVDQWVTGMSRLVKTLEDMGL